MTTKTRSHSSPSQMATTHPTLQSSETITAAASLSQQSTTSKLDALKFYRSECAHEFSLLGQRVSWFVMVQAFLITAFAVAIGYKTQGLNWFAQIVLPIIGIVTSLIVMPGVNGACDTVDMWIRKQRALCKDYRAELQDFVICRDEYQNLAEDKIHVSSYYFSRYLPWLTFVMWIVIMVLTFAVPIRII
jgi:small-conductance mechanosensitive channel